MMNFAQHPPPQPQCCLVLAPLHGHSARYVAIRIWRLIHYAEMAGCAELLQGPGPLVVARLVVLQASQNDGRHACRVNCHHSRQHGALELSLALLHSNAVNPQVAAVGLLHGADDCPHLPGRHVDLQPTDVSSFLLPAVTNSNGLLHSQQGRLDEGNAAVELPAIHVGLHCLTQPRSIRQKAHSLAPTAHLVKRARDVLNADGQDEEHQTDHPQHN
mmetsp:Transcript_43914/g.112180  ORF Transcript_43914/g.112180 Transcript_43914/m.112180 type:complete len:216 (-) Transcript_43914:354-1001(-)